MEALNSAQCAPYKLQGHYALRRFHHQAVLAGWLRITKFLQALQMQIERLTGMSESLTQRIPTGDNFWNVRKLDCVGRFLRSIADVEHVMAIFMRCRHHNSSTSRSLRMSAGWQVLRPPWGRTTVTTL